MPSPKSSTPERNRLARAATLLKPKAAKAEAAVPIEAASKPKPEPKPKPKPKLKATAAKKKAVAKGKKAAQRQLGLDWNVPALTAGVDEAGRGPLAGPVVAAAVILDPLKHIKGLDDSKKLTPETRARLYDEIMAKALCCSIAQASVDEIETLNILHATMLAMKRAVEGLRLKPGKVLVDGNRLPILKVTAEAVIGGDATVAAIAAASILAKVHRDRLCLDLHAAHPDYGFDVHKGYSTPEHLAALKRHGACAVHRRGFAPVREALEVFQMPGFAVPAGHAGSGVVTAIDTGISPELIEEAFAGARARSAQDTPMLDGLHSGEVEPS